MARVHSPAGDLASHVVAFGRLLHRMGLEVTPGRTIDACRSLQAVDVGREEDFYVALRANLVSRQEDWKQFDVAYSLYWHRLTAPPLEEVMESSEVGGGSPGEGQDGHLPVEAGYSPDPVYATRDFSTFADDEVERVGRLIARMAPRLAAVLSHRRRPDPRRRDLDLRRTLRRSLRYGGDPLDLAWRRRRIEKTRLVLLCDVSGSMDAYSRFLIQFVYALQNRLRGQVETFVFSTELHRVTHLLRSQPLAEGLAAVGRVVRDWSGGTRIGDCLDDFNRRYAAVLLGGRTVAIVISDGWDRGDPARLEEAMRFLQRRSRRVMWLNPLLGSPRYQPLCKGMRAALPYVDDFLPVHNLDSLVALAQALNDRARLAEPDRRRIWRRHLRDGRGETPRLAGNQD